MGLYFHIDTQRRLLYELTELWSRVDVLKAHGVTIKSSQRAALARVCIALKRNLEEIDGRAQERDSCQEP